MNFYEHTIVAKQNLSQKDIDDIEKNMRILLIRTQGKYSKLKSGDF